MRQLKRAGSGSQGDEETTQRRPRRVAALAVPPDALAHFGLEVLTASGRKLAALAIFRVVVPLPALACVAALLVLQVALSAPLAIACWCPAWMLALFRAEFTEQGATALRVLAVGATLSVLLSLTPTYLKYLRRNRTAYVVAIGAAALQAVLLLWWAPRFGAPGAALASATAMGAVFGTFTWFARREMLSLLAR